MKRKGFNGGLIGSLATARGAHPTPFAAKAATCDGGTVLVVEGGTLVVVAD